jgi:hypothetical protein
MHRHRKPVRPCHGCALNFRDHCGVYEEPRAMWERGQCSGYNNPDLIAEYERQRAASQPSPHDQRRAVQRLKATEPHYQGHRDPADPTARSRPAPFGKQEP